MLTVEGRNENPRGLNPFIWKKYGSFMIKQQSDIYESNLYVLLWFHLGLAYLFIHLWKSFVG